MREADLYCTEHGYRGFIADQSLLNAGVKHMLPPMDPTLTIVKDEIYTYHKETPGNVLMPFSSVAEGFFHRLILKGEGGGSYDTEENRRFAETIRTLQEKYGATLTQVLLGYFRAVPFYLHSIVRSKGPVPAGRCDENGRDSVQHRGFFFGCMISEFQILKTDMHKKT